jgi:hypothetical protein
MILAFLGSLALACGHSTGTARPDVGSAPSGPVRLKFAWPDGFQSHVLIAHETRRRGSEPTGLIARQRMVAEKRGNEIWVFTRDIAARGNMPDLETTMKINEALVEVVAPDGKFRRAEGVDQALAAMATSADDREKAREALIRSTAWDWELLVGAWSGQELEPEKAQRAKVKGYLPSLPAVGALLDAEYGMEARVPCTDEDTVRRCVQLSYRARLAPEARPATLEHLRQITASEDKAVPEDVHAELETLLVTEPETLIPHSMTQREHLRVRFTLPDGHVRETEERSEDTYIFSEHPPTEGERKKESTGL